MTRSQVNSAKRRFVNSCYTMRTVTKATEDRIAFCGAVGEPNTGCSEGGLGHLGCLADYGVQLAQAFGKRGWAGLENVG